MLNLHAKCKLLPEGPFDFPVRLDYFNLWITSVDPNFRMNKTTVLRLVTPFGEVSPGGIPANVVTAANNLVSPVTISFGQTPSTVPYSGLAPGFLGLYQFNVGVLEVADGDSQLNIPLCGPPFMQTAMFLTVHVKHKARPDRRPGPSCLVRGCRPAICLDPAVLFAMSVARRISPIRAPRPN